MTGPPRDTEALAELLARTPRLTAGYGAPDDYTRAAESLIARGVRLSGHPVQAMIAAAQRVVDECGEGTSGHGAPSLEAIEALRAALEQQVGA